MTYIPMMGRLADRLIRVDPSVFDAPIYTLRAPRPDYTDRDAAIVSAIEAGEAPIAIAARLGLSRERVRQIWVRETGLPHVPSRRRKVQCPVCGPVDERDFQRHAAAVGHPLVQARLLHRALAIVEWYSRGESTIEIGQRLGMAYANVNDTLRRAGVTPRKKGYNGRSRGRYRPVTEAEIVEAREARARGESWAAICIRTGRIIAHLRGVVERST